MKKYKVQITNQALADMEEIYTYIAEQLHSPENAMGQYNRIAETIESLDTFPERVQLMTSEPEHTLGFRQLPIDNFLIFYVIRENRINISPLNVFFVQNTLFFRKIPEKSKIKFIGKNLPHFYNVMLCFLTSS